MPTEGATSLIFEFSRILLIIFFLVHNHSRPAGHRGRIRPHKLRLFRGSALHHDERHWAVVHAMDEAGFGATDKSEHLTSRDILHNLRVFGHVSMLRDAARSRRRVGIHTVWYTRLLCYDRLANEAALAAIAV